MDNPRNLSILKKCVNSESCSLHNFVEEIQKNLSKDYYKAQPNNHVEVDEKTFSSESAIVETTIASHAIENSINMDIDQNLTDAIGDGAENVEEELVSCIVEEEYLETDDNVVDNIEDCIVEEEVLVEEVEYLELDRSYDENIATEILAQIEAEANSDVDEGSRTSTPTEEICTRKRGRNQKNWARNISKANRNSGKSYTNQKTAKIMGERSVQVGCVQKCSFNCSTNFLDSQRQELFNMYWKLGDISKQREFICNSIEEVNPKYRYARDGSNRQKNRSFYFVKDEARVRVCKKFFETTLNISAKVIETAQRKFLNNVIQPDLRGTHDNHSSIPQPVKNAIRSHINSFQRIESHYLRQQTKREYIDGGLNISLMYRMYKESCISDGLPFAKQHVYENVFNYEFNIGFFKPKKDQCIQCFEFENSSEERKTEKQNEHSKHILEKDLSRHQKEEDKKISGKNKSIKVICMDLQAVIPVPCGDVSSFYYKRRLLCFNFTIFELFSNEGFCFLWHEGIARRGSDEIAACLKIYLNKLTNIKHLIIWSDNCSGQNKNKYLLSFLIQLVQICNIESITQKFLIVGHTQNEGDNMHSLIEKNKARCLKSGPIYTCDQLVPIIQLAKKTKPLYKVHQLQTKEVYDLKDLCIKTGKNFTKNDENEKVVWADIKEIHVEKKHPNIVQYNTSFSETNYKSFKVSNDVRFVDFKPAYPDGPPKIPTAKKKDLMDLCKQNSITECHHNFFTNLRTEDPEIRSPIIAKKRRAGV